MEKTKYTHRFLARVVIEAVTPLAVASGRGSVMTDSEVLLDPNGLPYIPGTSIAGVIRHAIGEEKASYFFGQQDPVKSENSRGSEILFSECRMVGKEGRVMDGMKMIDFSDSFYGHFKELPIRQHTRIDHKGVSLVGGKFDEQVVFAGARFCFEIELLSIGKEREDEFVSFLETLKARSFRIGGKTRRGLGQIRIVSLQTACLDLHVEKDLNDYLAKSSALDASWSRWQEHETIDTKRDEGYDTYELCLKPIDFFSFGSGMGDEEADMIPVRATTIEWNAEGATLKDKKILIPGSSVKGALAHRVAWHYNRMNETFSDQLSKEELMALIASGNPAVKELFGYEDKKEQHPGNVLLSDLIKDREASMKLLNHVSIDRFTGGAMDGALFSEKVIYDPSPDDSTYDYRIELLVKKKAYSQHVTPAFERALQDICEGMLPLGGGVNRGNGCFCGKLYKNGEEMKWK